jgi:hypothetical protein
MPRKANYSYLKCHLCNKEFKRHFHFHKQNLYRKTEKVFCSDVCKNKYQRLNHGGNWKGGRRLQKGYVKMWVAPNTYMFEHRFIMEKYLGRKLTNREFIHHKNGIKDDNRLENLEIVNLNSHRGHIICPHCQKEFCIR